MKVTTEILIIPPGVAITGVFGKDLMAISRSTGANWEYNPEDKTIKLKGSPKSVQQSVIAINKQLGIHLAKVEQSNPSSRPKPLLRTKTLSSSTTSVGLKGVSAEIAKERASASLARSRSFHGSNENTSPSNEQTSQPFFVLRAPKFVSEDLWNFVPMNQASARDTPYVVLQQADPSLGRSSTTAPTDVTRRQLTLFHLEDKSVVALKTFMMLAASSTFEKDKVALRVVLGNQLFIKPKNHVLPAPENPVSFMGLQGIPEQYIRSHFNEQVNKTVAARLEKHITEDLGFAYCGERSEFRARVLDQSDGTLYAVVFAMNPEKGRTALLPIKVSKIQHAAHHVTYIRGGPVDFRLIISARDIIKDPVAANRNSSSTARFTGGGIKPRIVRRLSHQDSPPTPQTCADLFSFLRKVTWCCVSDATRPPSSTATGSSSNPFGASAVPSSSKIKLLYPTEDTMFSIESYQRLRKRRFEGHPTISTPSAFPTNPNGDSFDSYPSPPQEGDPASLAANKNLVRIKISRVDQSNDVRYFKATGSFVSLNEAIRNGRPDYFKLESCIQFFKDVAEGCRNQGMARKAGSWI